MRRRTTHDMASARMGRQPRRARIPLIIWLLAGIGLITVLVLFFRFAVVPVLVMLEGMA